MKNKKIGIAIIVGICLAAGAAAVIARSPKQTEVKNARQIVEENQPSTTLQTNAKSEIVKENREPLPAKKADTEINNMSSSTEAATEEKTETVSSTTLNNERDNVQQPAAETTNDQQNLANAGNYYALTSVNGFDVNNPVIAKMLDGYPVAIWLADNGQIAFFCGKEYIVGTYTDSCLNIGKYQEPYTLDNDTLTLTVKEKLFALQKQSETFPENASGMSENTKRFVKDLIGG